MAEEERVDLLVLSEARLAEARGLFTAQRPETREPCAQDRPPLVGKILGLDPDEAGPPEQRAVALEGLERRGRHPLRQARALPLPQGRVGDPVGEGEAAAGGEDAMAG